MDICKTVEIQQDFSSDEMAIFEFENTIQIENFDLIVAMFQHFGEIILEKLKTIQIFLGL